MMREPPNVFAPVERLLLRISGLDAEALAKRRSPMLASEPALRCVSTLGGKLVRSRCASVRRCPSPIRSKH